MRNSWDRAPSHPGGATGVSMTARPGPPGPRGSEGDIDGVIGDRDGIAAESHPSIGERPTSQEIELPAVPRACQYLSLAPPAIFPRGRGQRSAAHPPAANWCEFV